MAQSIKVYAEKFRKNYGVAEIAIRKLADIYGEYIGEVFDPDDENDRYETHREAFVREVDIPGVTEQFLEDLLLIYKNKIIPGILLYGKGLLRLRRMLYEDQQTLVHTGVDLVRDDKEHVRKRLVELTSSEVVRVVTPHGAIRNVAQQMVLIDRKARLQRHKADLASTEPGYAVLFHGVKFNTSRTYSIRELRRIICEWEETWGSSKRKAQ